MKEWMAYLDIGLSHSSLRGVPFIVSLIMVTLSHRSPASAGTASLSWYKYIIKILRGNPLTEQGGVACVIYSCVLKVPCSNVGQPTC